jgi:hypothetical protein
MHTAYTARLQAVIARERAKKKAQQAFLDDFQGLSDDVIRPVMEEFRSFLASVGTEASVINEKSESPEEYWHGTPTGGTSIAFVVKEANKPEYHQHSNNRVVFGANPDTLRIVLSVYSSSGGGPTGAEYSIGTLSRDLVEDEILDGIGRITASSPNVWGLDIGSD